MLDDFRRLLTDEDLRYHGSFLAQFPKWSFDRSTLSQFGMLILIGPGLVAVAAVAWSNWLQAPEAPRDG